MVGALVYKMLCFLEHETGGWGGHAAGAAGAAALRMRGRGRQVAAAVLRCRATAPFQGSRVALLAQPLPTQPPPRPAHPAGRFHASSMHRDMQWPMPHAGERFEAKDHQYKWLARLAMEVFGGRCTAGYMYSCSPTIAAWPPPSSAAGLRHQPRLPGPATALLLAVLLAHFRSTEALAGQPTHVPPTSAPTHTPPACRFPTLQHDGTRGACPG